jgi:hypothetical protein
MVTMGIGLAVLSGLFNGLFTTPMKLEPRWKWENTWFVFIVVACLMMPIAIVFGSSSRVFSVLVQAPTMLSLLPFSSVLPGASVRSVLEEAFTALAFRWQTLWSLASARQWAPWFHSS